MEFRIVKKSHGPKKKLMLWIGQDLIEKVELIKPAEITVQEAMRQMLVDKLDDMEMMESL